MINTRRTRRIIALAVGLSLVAAACGGDDDAADEPADTPADEPSDEPARKSTGNDPSGNRFSCVSEPICAGGGSGGTLIVVEN